MSLFRRPSLSFSPIDPLADGLGDKIEAEQAEPERFELHEQLDSRLAEAWDRILEDTHLETSYAYVRSDE